MANNIENIKLKHINKKNSITAYRLVIQSTTNNNKGVLLMVDAQIHSLVFRTTPIPITYENYPHLFKKVFSKHLHHKNKSSTFGKNFNKTNLIILWQKSEEPLKLTPKSARAAAFAWVLVLWVSLIWQKK